MRIAIRGILMKELSQIYIENKDKIKNLNDITGGDDPEKIFNLLIKLFGYLLDDDVDKTVSKFGIKLRREINKVIEAKGASFLSNEQVIENRKYLRSDGTKPADSFEPDSKIILPDTPVIWTSNHAFKDDTLASILTIYRHAYILFGSLPQFFNSFDGITAWLNGVVMTNRKLSSSRAAAIPKSVKVMNCGADMFIFPEGVLNKTPNQLLIDLWPGVYRLACEKGALVVPIAHYIRDRINAGIPGNVIHSVVDEPIRIDDLSEKAALAYLRDIMATWYYLMMEKYGQSTRKKELAGFTSADESWEHHLNELVKTVGKYDKEIETTAAYVTKEKKESDAVSIWEPILNSNVDKETKEYVEKMIRIRTRQNFQGRF